ncbi:MAG: YggT family protein [Gammaproteobacteria bacterium]|nr:YggT family protein [Gammaproteobacteria bacterium]
MDAIDNGLFFLVNLIFSLYSFVLMLRIISEWLGADYYNPLWQFIAKLTDKPLWLFQKIMPKRLGKFDLPAFILLLLVDLAKFGLFLVIDKALVLVPRGMMLIAGISVWIITDLVRELINLYCYMIIIFVILSWIRSSQLNHIGFILFRLVEPILRPARRIIPLIANIDLSPIIVFVLLQLIKIVAVMPIFEWSLQTLFDWLRHVS